MGRGGRWRESFLKADGELSLKLKETLTETPVHLSPLPLSHALARGCSRRPLWSACPLRGSSTCQRMEEGKGWTYRQTCNSPLPSVFYASSPIGPPRRGEASRRTGAATHRLLTTVCPFRGDDRQGSRCIASVGRPVVAVTKTTAGRCGVAVPSRLEWRESPRRYPRTGPVKPIARSVKPSRSMR